MADLPQELAPLRYGEGMINALAKIGAEIDSERRQNEANAAAREALKGLNLQDPNSFLQPSFLDALTRIPRSPEGEEARNRIFNVIGLADQAAKLKISAVGERRPGEQAYNKLTGENVGGVTPGPLDTFAANPTPTEREKFGLPEYVETEESTIDPVTLMPKVNRVKVPVQILYDKNTNAPVLDQNGAPRVVNKTTVRVGTPATHAPNGSGERGKAIPATYFSVNTDKDGNVSLHQTKQTYANAVQLVNQADTELKSIDSKMYTLQTQGGGLISQKWQEWFGTNENWDTIKDKLDEGVLTKITNQNVRNLATAYLKWKELKANNWNRYQEETGNGTGATGASQTTQPASGKRIKLNSIKRDQ